MTPAYINKTGFTYCSLRSSRDKSDTQPVAPTYSESVTFFLLNYATVEWRPTLLLEHEAIPTTQFFFGLKNRR